MKEVLFTGAGVAIVTPFTETGVNFLELGRLIDFTIKGGVDAIIIAGTTGESSTMTDEEHKEAISYAVEHTAGRVPVIAGTGSNDTDYALQLSLYAQEAGANGLPLVTPYYNKTSQHGLIEHFTYIADRVELPIVLYNVPSRTGVSIAPETYAALAEHPRIVATKEASGDMTALLKARALCGDKLGIYSGNDDQIVPIMAMGGLGVISVLANIMPQETHEICRRFAAGDVAGSAALQIALADLIAALFCDVNPIPVKTALNLMGCAAGPLRRPLTGMNTAGLTQLRAAMTRHGLLKA